MSSADTFDIMLAASGAFAPDGQPLSAFIKEIKYDEFYGGWSCIGLNLRFTRVLYRRMSFSWASTTLTPQETLMQRYYYRRKVVASRNSTWSCLC